MNERGGGGAAKFVLLSSCQKLGSDFTSRKGISAEAPIFPIIVVDSAVVDSEHILPVVERFPTDPELTLLAADLGVVFIQFSSSRDMFSVLEA